jgi:hypothetical protein
MHRIDGLLRQREHAAGYSPSDIVDATQLQTRSHPRFAKPCVKKGLRARFARANLLLKLRGFHLMWPTAR